MDEHVNPPIKKKRIFYFDLLRALAIISVVIFHLYTACNFLVLKEYSILSLKWLFTDFIAADFRFGVDLFLMMSGALVLGRSTDLKSFLTKRIPRISIPFVFWVVVLSIFSVFISISFPQIWPVIDVAHFNILGFFTYIYNSFTAVNRGFTHLWFFWMILGIYLIMPVINKWILYNKDSKSYLEEMEYFLIIWVAVCILNNTLNFPLHDYLAYFTGPIGMVILGYYLRYTDREILNNPYYAIVALVGVAIVAMYVSFILSGPNKIKFFDNYSIFNVIEVTAIFIIAKNFDKLNTGLFRNPNGRIYRSIVSIAKYSYGIYLVHRIFLSLFLILLVNKIPYIPLLVVLFILTLGVSWGLMRVLDRITFLKDVIN